jgi:exodeoxyribonuclease V beta subunit
MVDSKDWIQFVDAQMARLPLPVLTTEQLNLWLMQIIHYPMRLSQQTVKLADIAQQQLWAEMDFHLPLSSLKTPQLDALVSQMILPALPRAALGYQALGGMLKGFMDLVFEHQGQYFVLDYKSNKLSSYDTQSLNTSMLAERYDVQAALYIVALHRLLGVRLSDYDYDRHIGGAVYIYLRGVDQQDTSSVWFAKPDRHYVEALDALLAGRT